MTSKNAIKLIREAFDSEFEGRSVFVTGHTGFKGSWLTIWLHQLGAKVSGFSMNVPTCPSNFKASRVGELIERHVEADLRSISSLQTSLEKADPDVVFHLAAQPLVRESYRSPHDTFETNFMGTCNLLEAIRLRAKPCVVVVITSDKCYENQESHHPYLEDDAMGGHDPYSASKGAVELLVASYRRSFFPAARVSEHGIKLASARAGNVIGGGDWAQDRLVPDIVEHLNAQRPVPVRNPAAVRPWQHVLEPLSGYLTLASRMLVADDPELCSGWNFGPHEHGSACVSTLVERFCAAWKGGTWDNVSTPGQPHEAKLLRLSIEKAKSQLSWHPVWQFEQSVQRTVQWYRAFNQAAGASMLNFCLQDIADYSRDSLAVERGSAGTEIRLSTQAA